MRRRILPAGSALAALALASCVSAPPAPPPVVRAPAPAPPPPAVTAPPPLADDWRDWPLTPGTWRYAGDSRGTRAMFGDGGDAVVVLRCDRSERRMYLSRTGAGIAPITVRTSSVSRAVAVQPTGGAQPYVAAALAINDPLLDAMAFSRGRFVIQQQGAATLVIPAYAEVGRVIEDCRG
ncbi:hypothetical protein [Sphingomonas lycopersici]|uniref:Lipoprotein n=1 Tax=Sphingomonas lycopersici TaxID=2951807 RepID=A0AA41ZFL6_9SPHN|nr:hypothetical protein [Sphingomonas lycopersici]MCW6535721.1 hypothetical protein [Sphingomonas lycopersici]